MSRRLAPAVLFVLCGAAACGGKAPEVQAGALVRLDYTVRADGELVDTTEGFDPLTVRIGSGQLLAALEERLLGLAAGDDVEFKLPPAQAYGEPDPAALQKIPRARFGAQGQGLRPGMKVQGMLGGTAAEARIVGVEEDTVTLDFNPPLAGKTLEIRVRILAVSPPERGAAHASDALPEATQDRAAAAGAAP